MQVNKLNSTYEQNLTFNARCPQIRDADWVCRVINQTLPHSSTSKHQTRIIKFLKSHRDVLKYEWTPRNLAQICEILKKKYRGCNNMLQQKMNNIKKFIENFGKKRLEAQDIMPNKVFESLYLMEVFKVGNCSENAVLAELVLKMNNIRNACCATMFKAVPGDSCCDWSDLDHAVCVFNKDGSLFNGKKTKHTIVIDPWVGKAGFMDDMERFYRNELSGYFNIEPHELFKYERVETVYVSDFAMEKLKEKYTPFIFKNKTRSFMKD